MAAFADGDRKKFIRNDDLHGAVGLVDDHARDLCRGQSIAHISGRVNVPRNDVDLFSPQFLDHILHPATLHPDAGTHRIDVGIAGGDGYLGPHTGFAGRPHDFDDTFADLRHFHFKQVDQKIDMGARQDNLRTATLV